MRQALGIADEPDPLDPHLSTLDENDPFTTNLCAACAPAPKLFVHARPATPQMAIVLEAHLVAQ